MFVRIKVPVHEAEYFSRSGSECNTECRRISTAPPVFVSPKDADTPRMNDHTGERKGLAHIENSNHQQYGGTLEQNRNRSTRMYDG